MGGSYPFGLFSWTDIAVPDTEAAKTFYSGLFGWEAADQQDPEGNHIYTMFSLDGKSAAGMGEQMQEMTDQGIPPTWNSYVTVASVDETIDKVTAAGGSVMMPAVDVPGAGRMAFVGDPAGAAFALWQAGDHKGAEVFNVHGAMTWNELATPDIDAARKFYGDAIGWDFEEFPGVDSYWVIVLDNKIDGDEDKDDNYNGGMMPLANLPEGTPSFWGVYFSVDDADAAVAKAIELGGSSVMPAMDTPAGRIGVIADPQGAIFNVIQAPAEQ